MSGRPVLLFPAAVRAGTGQSPDAYTPDDILAGMEAYLNTVFNPSMLPTAPGGGVEVVGMSQAVNDMLVQAPNG